MVTELPVVVGAEVRQLMVLPVRPQVLDRVEFRSVGRKELQPQPPALLPYEVPDHSAAVTAQGHPRRSAACLADGAASGAGTRSPAGCESCRDRGENRNSTRSRQPWP